MSANRNDPNGGKTMANLIVVCGPQAVGKMTVAESLRDKLKYNMTMNHDSIEISDRIFGFNTPAQREFGGMFRKQVFDLAVKYDVDLIFTYVCAFDMPSEREYLTALAQQFEATGGQFYLIELRADIETRLARNETPHRMERKPSKRDVEWSRNNLLSDANKYRLNSNEDEVWFPNHLKIDNTNLSPDEVADLVIRHFSLTPNDKPERDRKSVV